jgi:secreted trypsin-like serine protease
VPETISLLTRYRADLFVVNATGFVGLKQVPGSGYFATSGDAKHGGTCFGDSGGPALIAGTDTIVGVTSFALNGNCAGVGGSYRIDRTTDLEFIGSFLKD